MIASKDLARAVSSALAGRWKESHEIVMRDEDGELACWIHAVLHRQEGDLANARYWYARCGRRLRKGLTPEEEFREIEKALG
jgi:hypothetical protein